MSTTHLLSSSELATLFVDRIVPALYARLLAIAFDKDVVEDALEQTFFNFLNAYRSGTVRFLNEPPALSESNMVASSFYNYCLRSSIREVWRILKERRRTRCLPVDCLECNDSIDPVAAAYRTEIVEQCRQVLQRLSLRHQTVLLLSIECDNYAEVAEAMCISVTTLKPLLHRAKRAFADHWNTLYGQYA